MEKSKENVLKTSMTIEKVAEQILYLPVTNGKAGQSIRFGTNLIQSLINTEIAKQNAALIFALQEASYALKIASLIDKTNTCDKAYKIVTEALTTK